MRGSAGQFTGRHGCGGHIARHISQATTTTITYGLSSSKLATIGAATFSCTTWGGLNVAGITGAGVATGFGFGFGRGGGSVGDPPRRKPIGCRNRGGGPFVTPVSRSPAPWCGGICGSSGGGGRS